MTVTTPLFNADHPLGALPQDAAEGINQAIGLALDGITGWSYVIGFTRATCEQLVVEGKITDDQAEAAVEYSRSF